MTAKLPLLVPVEYSALSAPPFVPQVTRMSSPRAASGNGLQLTLADAEDSQQPDQTHEATQQRATVDLLERGSVYHLTAKMLSQGKRGDTLMTVTVMLMTFLVQVLLMVLLLRAAQSGKTAIGTDPSDIQQRHIRAVQVQLCSMLGILQQLTHNTSNTTLTAPAALSNCGCVLAHEGLLELAGGTNSSEEMNNSCNNFMSGWSTNFTLKALGTRNSVASQRQQAPRELAFEVAAFVVFVLVVVQCYTLREACEACVLWYAVGAYAGSKYVDKAYDGAKVYSWFRDPRGKVRKLIACCIPWLQLTTAVLAFCTAAALLVLPDIFSDKVQLVLNGVAVVFILEVDDKVGDVVLLMTEQQPTRHPGVPSVYLISDVNLISASPCSWILDLLMIVSPFGVMFFCQGWYVSDVSDTIATAVGMRQSDVTAASAVLYCTVICLPYSVWLTYGCCRWVAKKRAAARRAHSMPSSAVESAGSELPPGLMPVLLRSNTV
jgi:hypothetical protein